MKNGLTSYIEFMLRSLAIILLTIAYSTLTLLGFACRLKHEFYFSLAKQWSSALLYCAGVTVTIKGLDHLQGLDSRIYIVNHTSYFDIPILLASLPDNVRIMYRRNLEKIPFLGWSMKASPFIAIDRDDPRNAMKSIQEAIAAVQSGESVIVFAEGTRSKDGRLGLFKRGAFLLAARSKKPIIPIALIGAHSIMPKSGIFFKPGHTTLSIQEPFPSLQQEDKQAEKILMEAVHESIRLALPINMQPSTHL